MAKKAKGEEATRTRKTGSEAPGFCTASDSKDVLVASRKGGRK